MSKGTYRKVPLPKNMVSHERLFRNEPRQNHGRLQVAGATTPPSPTSLPGDALSIAHTGLHQLAQHLQAETPLDIKDHKLLSDALAQYVKVLLIAPQEETQETGLFIDIGKLPAWKRMELRRLLASDAPQGEAI